MQRLPAPIFNLLLLAMALYCLALFSLCGALWLSNGLLKDYHQAFLAPSVRPIIIADTPVLDALAEALAWPAVRQDLKQARQHLDRVLRQPSEAFDSPPQPLWRELVALQQRLDATFLRLAPFMAPLLESGSHPPQPILTCSPHEASAQCGKEGGTEPPDSAVLHPPYVSPRTFLL